MEGEAMTDASDQNSVEESTNGEAATRAAPHSAPVAIKDRFESLDVLRGVAVLGILMLNVQAFLMASNAYIYPPAHMDITGVNLTTWQIQWVFFDSKFITTFSALFGAGMLLMVGDAPDASRKLHFSRMTWLLVFGLLHMFVFWFGDILTTYALAGFIIVFFRQMSATKLIVWGLIWLAISGLLYIGAMASMGLIPEDQLAENHPLMYAPSDLRDLVGAYQTGFLESRGYNAINGAFNLGSLVLVGGRIIGVMFLGMALFKLGFLTAKWSVRSYLITLVIGLGVGWPIAAYGMNIFVDSGFDVRQLWIMLGTNYIAMLFVALGYASLVMLICKAPWLKIVRYPFACAGRMAFTNYLGQTFIMVFIAVGGIGLGQFGQLERIEQVQLVVAVWVFQLIFSVLWLQVFRMGPLEWLWRTLSYGRVQPLFKAKA